MELITFRNTCPGLRKYARIISSQAKIFDCRVVSVDVISETQLLKITFAFGKEKNICYVDYNFYTITARKRIKYHLQLLTKREKNHG